MTFARELELTADRLRQLSPARLLPQQEAVYSVLDAMTTRVVPRLQPRAWGDQLLLIGREVDSDDFTEAVRELRRRFDLTL